jgi:hypothetical protein
VLSIVAIGIPTGKISVIEGKSNLGYSRLTRTIKIYQRTIRILKMLNRKK